MPHKSHQQFWRVITQVLREKHTKGGQHTVPKNHFKPRRPNSAPIRRLACSCNVSNATKYTTPKPTDGNTINELDNFDRKLQLMQQAKESDNRPVSPPFYLELYYGGEINAKEEVE
mmetsp:Transcript_27784/g.33979  ORF Transcript_27784/g.33979 Transcript_27784/m.33979 type:complete len:116 (-) Transcript_27784:413-760(-)